ncbi:hypothetical protein D3C80_2072610 [compost metagenome]
MNPPITSVRVGHHASSNPMVMAPMTHSRADGAGIPRALAPIYYAEYAGNWTSPEGEGLLMQGR